MTVRPVARFGAFAFAALAGLTILFHLAMILGAPFGEATMGGRWPGVLPMPVRILSLLSACLTIGMAMIALVHGGVVVRDLARWTRWVPVVFAVLAVLANLASPSPVEQVVWVPVTALMLAAALCVALG